MIPPPPLPPPLSWWKPNVYNTDSLLLHLPGTEALKLCFSLLLLCCILIRLQIRAWTKRFPLPLSSMTKTQKTLFLVKLLRLPCVLISHFFLPEDSNPQTKLCCTCLNWGLVQVCCAAPYGLCVCVLCVWVSDRAWERLGHNDTLVSCCRRRKKKKEKPSWWKCTRGPYTSHLFISQLASCWSKPICLGEGSERKCCSVTLDEHTPPPPG